MGVPTLRATVQAARDSSTGCLPSGTRRFQGGGTGRPKRSDSPGASCGTRSHRPLARLRFGQGSQYTDHRQMGPSHYGTWTPAACGYVVRKTRAIALWFVPLIFRLVLFIVAAPMFMRPSGVDPYVAKVAQANIQAILPKFVVNTIRQARQKRSFAKLERIVTNY